MAKAMNLEIIEMSATEELENQQDYRNSCNELDDMKNFAIMAFENPGLCHIGEKIFKNLDLPTKLHCRLVRKSWNDIFEKQASTIDLGKEPKWNRFLTKKSMWRKFLKEPKTEIPTLVLNYYLQDLFNSVRGNFDVEFGHRTPLLAFARTGKSKIVDFILRTKIITFEVNECDEALEYAAMYGHVNVAKLLKPLMLITNHRAISNASRSGHLVILKVLIDNDPIAMNLDHHIIWSAACSGKIEVLEYFESLNRDWFQEALLIRNGLEKTIFHHLAEEGHLEVIKYLCQKALFRDPIQSDIRGRTPIHCAAGKGHLEVVKFLAPYTLNPNAARFMDVLQFMKQLTLAI